jgi:hypothetical protein
MAKKVAFCTSIYPHLPLLTAHAHAAGIHIFLTGQLEAVHAPHCG